MFAYQFHIFLNIFIVIMFCNMFSFTENKPDQKPFYTMISGPVKKWKVSYMGQQNLGSVGLYISVHIYKLIEPDL